ncbi:MAG: hypothetical protein JXR96_04380 [Deltaproteobacteria bacterium]|nr:hypothetical protein [Deltaproteobacteria bacterium]
MRISDVLCSPAARALLTLSCIALASLPLDARAEEPGRQRFGSGGLRDLDTDSRASFDLHIPLGDGFSSVVPELSGQIGLGPAAAGVSWTFSYFDFDTWDDETYFGAVDLFVKGRYCFEGERGSRTCIGGQLDLAISTDEVDEGEISSFIAGCSTYLSWHRFGSESAGLVPALVFDVQYGWLFLQGHLGVDVVVPLGERDRRDTEALLIFGSTLGVNALELISAGLGFRGLATLTRSKDDSAFALDLLLQGHFGFIHPSFGISIPLDGDTRVFFDLFVSLGATITF